MGRRFAMAALRGHVSAATSQARTPEPRTSRLCPATHSSGTRTGSWTTMRDVPVGGMGRKLVLRQGSELRPGAAILSVDFATLLDQQCPSVSVAVPAPASDARRNRRRRLSCRDMPTRKETSTFRN